MFTEFYPPSPHKKTQPTQKREHLVKGAGPLGDKHLLCRALRHAVRQRELQVLRDELLDVGAADIGGLLELDDLKDLFGQKADR